MGAVGGLLRAQSSYFTDGPRGGCAVMKVVRGGRVTLSTGLSLWPEKKVGPETIQILVLRQGGELIPLKSGVTRCDMISKSVEMPHHKTGVRFGLFSSHRPWNSTTMQLHTSPAPTSSTLASDRPPTPNRQSARMLKAAARRPSF